MLLLLAIFALVPAAHGCVPSIVVTDDAGGAITTASVVRIGQSLTITCEFVESADTCTSKTLQIGEAAATVYDEVVTEKLTDVADIKFICSGTANSAVTPAELTLNIRCQDPEENKITAVLSYVATDEKMKLECDAQSTCASAAVYEPAGVIKASSGTNDIVDGNTGVRFKKTYLSEEITATDLAAGYMGTCTYGGNEKTVTFCPEDTAISFTDATGVITPTANGEAFTVKCDFQSCTHEKFMVDGTDTGLTKDHEYVQEKGVLTATNYTCMNGDDKIATTTVKCMAGMSVLNSVGGVCKTTLKPITCTKQDDGTYKKSCEEADTTSDVKQCRCPASKPYYHIADGKCEEKCGAQGLFVSMILVVAAFLRFL